MNMLQKTPIKPAPLSRSNPRHVSVKLLLHWVTGIEFAKLDFDELGPVAGQQRRGISTE